MLNKAKLHVETKAIEPADEDFEFESDPQIEDHLLWLLNLREEAYRRQLASQSEKDALFFERLTSALGEIWVDVALFYVRIQAGEFDQPEQPAPVNQPEIEERHRAPF